MQSKIAALAVSAMVAGTAVTSASQPAQARGGGGAIIGGLIAGALIGGALYGGHRYYRHRYYDYPYAYSYAPSYYGGWGYRRHHHHWRRW